VIGQARTHMLAKRVRIDIGKSRDIGDELLVLCRFTPCPCDYDGFAHGRMTGELRFDLAEFDAEAANLDLMIVASEELEIAIGAITREIARAIDSGIGNEWIVEEAFGGEIGTIEITARHTRATDIQLAHGTGRHE